MIVDQMYLLIRTTCVFYGSWASLSQSTDPVEICLSIPQSWLELIPTMPEPTTITQKPYMSMFMSYIMGAWCGRKDENPAT